MPALCLCVALALVAAPATQPATAQTTRPQPRFSASERAASARITPAAISGPIRFLSDDLLDRLPLEMHRRHKVKRDAMPR